MKKELSVLARKNNVDMLYSLQRECYNLQNLERVEQFECIKSEADQILFFIYSQIRKECICDTVIIDAEDTDVIVFSTGVAHEIDGDLGMKWKKTFFDCKELCSSAFSKVVLQLYYHPGADAVSAFSVMERGLL